MGNGPEYWKATENQRLRFEPLMISLVNKTLDDQFMEIAKKIDVTNYRSDALVNSIEEDPIKKMFIELYKKVGVFFARQETERLKSGELTFKKIDPADYIPNRMTEEDKYNQWLENYVRTRLGMQITGITNESRKQALNIIRKIIDQGMVEGWSATQIAKAIRKGLEDLTMINQWRAMRIARTEIGRASNVGSYVSAQDFAKESGLRLQKYWIPVYDDRTRDTHSMMEAQGPKPLEEPWLVGGVWPAECPGDPDLPPEESINCRCTQATEIIL
jgi:hypothetical protein